MLLGILADAECISRQCMAHNFGQIGFHDFSSSSVKHRLISCPCGRVLPCTSAIAKVTVPQNVPTPSRDLLVSDNKVLNFVCAPSPIRERPPLVIFTYISEGGDILICANNIFVFRR